jgi:hypothetical protein
VQTLGIAIEPGAGKPKLHGVVAGGSSRDPVLIDEFEITPVGTGVSEQAVELAQLLQGKLPGLRFGEAAIRIASASRPRGNRLKGNSFRAHAEGAVLFVLREHLKRPIFVGDPQALASKIEESKDGLNALAIRLSKRNSDAAMAAIAALPTA